MGRAGETGPPCSSWRKKPRSRPGVLRRCCPPRRQEHGSAATSCPLNIVNFLVKRPETIPTAAERETDSAAAICEASNCYRSFLPSFLPSFSLRHCTTWLSNMKFVFSCLLLFLAAVAQALSPTGDRLLTIWEDVEDVRLYTKFIGGLESMESKPEYDPLHLLI